MSDIYIVYASEDEAVAEKLYELLSQQWETWWDDKIVGRFRQVIESEVPKAKCMVAILSQFSRDKDTFNEELRLGQKNNLEILPIGIDNSELSYPFGVYSITKMYGWNGEVDHRGFMQLQRRLTSVALPKSKPQRPKLIAGGKIPLPTVFMSISSHETQLKPIVALQSLRLFGSPNILISAYDLVSRRNSKAIIDELNIYREKEGFVLIDSGNYEKSRLRSKRWSPADLHEVLTLAPHDWVFCFDILKPKHDPDRAIEEILQSIEREQMHTLASVLPIVHAPKLKQGGYKLKHIPRIIRELSEKLEPPLIAIPERELGVGLIARARTVQTIRAELNKLPFYQPLHILGTGNPWSIPVLVAAGADSFDGLEWCRMAVDRDTHRLHHFQHFDFFDYQKAKAETLIARAFLEDDDIDFVRKVVFHNLDYYFSFIKEMREYVNEDNIEAFMVGIMGDSVKKLKKQVKGIFE